MMKKKPSCPMPYRVLTCSFILCALLIAACSYKAHGQAPGSELVGPGVVLDKFEDEFSGAKLAGMEEGDILLSWSRGSAHGKIDSPFEILRIGSEEFAMGPVTIEGMRGGEKRTWTIIKPYWGVVTLPLLRSDLFDLYRQGEKLAGEGKLLDAANCWRNAAHTVKDSEYNKWLATWFLSRAGDMLSEGQLWKEADQNYQDAIAQEEHASDPAIRILLACRWAGSFLARSDWDSAANTFKQSLLEAQKTNHGNLAVADLQGLGRVSQGRGDLLEAERYYRQQLAVAEELEPDTLSTATAFMDIGNVLQLRGDLAGSEEAYRKALAGYVKRAPGSEGHAYILGDLGEIAEGRGDLEGAETYLRAALKIIEIKVPGTANNGIALDDLANVLMEKGDDRQAEKILHQALAIEDKVAPNGLEVADAHESLGDIARRRADLDSAESLYKQALAIREKLAPGSLGVGESLDALGDIRLARNDLAEAEHDYARSIAIREKLGYTGLQGDDLFSMARIRQVQGRQDDAERFYAQGLSTRESQAAQLGGGSLLRAGYRAKYEKDYREYIDLLLEQSKPEVAFNVLERSRARTLLETLATGRVEVRAGADPALLEQEHSLQAELRSKSELRAGLISEQAVGQTKNSEQLAALEKEISKLTSDYQSVESLLRSTSPDYASLTQPRSLTINEVQELLGDHTLLLEYSLGEERSHVFAVTPDSLQAFDLPKSDEIERIARQVYQLIAARNIDVRGETNAARNQRSRLNEQAFSQAVAELSRMVLAPVAAELGHKRLVIVADGALAYIPFAVLPEPRTPEKPEDSSVEHGADGSTSQASRLRKPVQGPAPLVVNHEIVNLPSASVLAVLRQQKTNRPLAARAVAVLADPVFDHNDPRVGQRNSSRARLETSAGVRRSQGGFDDPRNRYSVDMLARSAGDLGLTRKGRLALPRLRYSRQEADAILAVAPAGQAMEALDFRASRATATDPALSQYRVVHFATHGLLNSEHPELSGLVLSLVDEKGQPQDGFLDLQDIYNLDLHADLVVLSACETGLGKEISGEGLVGLTRGFMYAGASRVVASLWTVSDAATAHLMAKFYKAMEQDGMTPAAALRTAQVEMLKEKRWSSPYYWAPFQIQGDWK